MRRAAKVDRNQPEIIAALRKAGAHVIPTHQLKNAFDCLVFYCGRTMVVEIKDGTKPPSAQRLTDGERKCRDAIESRHVKYHIITSVDEALQMLDILKC
jgi:hypothetical protein